ncbi:MAG TPA: hypothetical protein VGI66_18745 [Streptosporangiaceae bacterium]|jgi:hypothetical protein
MIRIAQDGQQQRVQLICDSGTTFAVIDHVFPDRGRRTRSDAGF